ncbi:RNA-directed DNA polymerase [Kitasatospora sp. NPDC085895]|uniref:RNA-directed DNA polymerase n=1 Tax=Kitasatospora sp. NPDC085895 TaxID=3155057 RepID=UPI00344CD7CA
MPELIIDRCFENCQPELATLAELILAGNVTYPYETLAMPRKRFGPRPVTIATTPARIAYQSLVNHLGDALGPRSREGDNWDKHRDFALDSGSDYVVKFDIASFYEYVDHDILRQSVLNQSLDPASTDMLGNVLQSVIGGTRGLPQLSTPSDHLADVYIAPLERRLARDGFTVSRYVDDFTVACADWETANIIIERSAEYARSLGLVLSSEKTKINKRATLVLESHSESEFFHRYFDLARVELSQVFFWGDYGELISFDETETPDESATMQAAMWQLVNDWHSTLSQTAPEDIFHTEGHFRTYLASAFGWLRGYGERIPDSVMQDAVFRHPLLLVAVCGYIAARAAEDSFAEDPWESLWLLTIMGRQSAWAKIWLLNTISGLPTSSAARYPHVMEWVTAQIEDRHETVRAEATWTAATHKVLSEGQMIKAYMMASPISQGAVAASMGRQGSYAKSAVSAITGDGPLIKKAYEWACQK